MDIQSADIFIVGAGPTGLMLANLLTRFGITYIIADQKSGPTDQSRALVVQSRSLEIYEQLGLSDGVVAEGQITGGVNFYRNGKYTASVVVVNADEDASPFPYLLMYEQSKNETVLYRNLQSQHKEVLWNTCINRIEKENEEYHLSAKQGEINLNFKCRFLIACDGSKSIVREFSQMPFEGGSYLNVFYVADTHVNANLGQDRIDMFLTKSAVTLLFPMKGNNHFRVLGILPKEYYNRTEIPFEEILDNAKTGMRMPVEFHDTQWHSTYRLHHKKVQRFSSGNIFFAGDAAHVHSPAGGQGMNTGLQDAWNLAWKLALVVQGKSDPSLLNSYHEERNPVAQDLLKTTDRMFSGMTTDNFWFGLLRMYVVPYLAPSITKFKSVRKKLYRFVSQINIAYLSSSLSRGSAGKIRAGMRLPYFLVAGERGSISVFTLVNQSSAPFSVLLFNISQAPALQEDLFHLIVLSDQSDNKKNFKKMGLPDSFVIVVRPDNYIAYISTSADGDDITRFMKEAYHLQTV